MSDPLSIAASVAGLLSLGIQVSESFLKFYAAYKIRKLEGILTVFRSLQATLKAREFYPEEGQLVQSIEDSIKDCNEIIQELAEESKKYIKIPDGGTRDKIRTATRRVAYPFRASTLSKLEEDIHDIHINLWFALHVLNQGDQKAVYDDLISVKSLLTSLQVIQVSSAIRGWLKAPDATVNHHSACAKRRAETGMWFIDGQHYSDWLEQDNSFLWLNGFAGCGKLKADIGVDFFYFTFSDQFKQDESAMAKALLLQLAGQREECEDELEALYQSCQSGTPRIDALLASLQKMFQNFVHVYILLDALDECTSLRKWQAHRAEIQSALSEGAQGVFRYVEFQLKDLQRCSRTKVHLSKRLQSLPKDLEETYDRTLCNIDEFCVDDARRILTSLCFSIEPLTNRLLDAEGVNDICLGLIEVIPGREAKVRIAHFQYKNI
ncbi:unnamed protein product [Penicillium manginii]